jgi:transcriptional regulator with XRE-family HTH domain
MAGKPTLKDVARRAGVSGMTVSRVINGGEPVSEARRQAVHRAAAELGYMPNRAAQALALAKREIGDQPGTDQNFGRDAIDDTARLATIALRVGSAVFRTFAAEEFASTEQLRAELEREGLDSERMIALLFRSAFIMHSKDASLFLTARGSHLRHKTSVAILASAGILDVFKVREAWSLADKQSSLISPAR